MNTFRIGKAIMFHGVWAAGLTALTLVMGWTLPAMGGDGSWTNKTPGGNWSDATKWSGGTVADGAGFTAWFTNDITTSANTITVDGSRTVGLVFVGDAITASGVQSFKFIPGSGATLTFDNGSANAQLNQTATAVNQTIGVPLVLASSLVVSNASAYDLTLTNGITGTGNLILNAAAAGDIILTNGLVNPLGAITNSGSGAGGVWIGPIIGPNVLGVVQKSATSLLTLYGANTFTNGLFIKAGTVSFPASATANALGADSSIITLGDSTGNAAATLSCIGAATFQNPISVASGNAGTATIVSASGSAFDIFSGAVTLNSHDLILAVPGSMGTLEFRGGVTGTGNLILINNRTSGAGNGAITLSTAAVNPIGTITNSGAAAGAALISGGVGPNVTAITVNGASPLIITNTPLTVNSSGTILANINSGTAKLAVAGGVNGTGNLVLNNNSTIANGITVSTEAVTNVGQVINSGTGSGNTLISAVIGANVTAVIQNSANSPLTLSGANTYVGDTLISNGTLTVGVANAIPGGTGKGNVLVNGTLDVTLANTINGLSGTGTVNNSSGTARILTVGANDQTSVFSGNITNTGSATSLALTKVGSGTLTLSGVNGYGGATLVSNGMLSVDGNLAGAGAVTVTTNGVLGGTGVISRAVTIATGTGGCIGGGFAPGGTDVGTLRINGNFTLAPSTTASQQPVWSVQLDATTNDLLVVNGSFTMASSGKVTLKVSNAGGASVNGQTYTLLTWTNANPAGGAAQFEVVLLDPAWAGGTVTVDTGAKKVTLSGLEDAAATGIINVIATNVLNTTADLIGNLASTGVSPTTVWAFWDTTDRTTNKTWTYSANFVASTLGLITNSIVDLTPNQTSYFTYYASNTEGEVWAQPSLAFKTWGPPSVDNDGGATDFSQTSATLRGTLLNGKGAYASIIWGVNEDLASATTSTPTWVTEGVFPVPVESLTQNTTYYYQCFVSNAYGTATASSITNFTTLASVTASGSWTSNVSGNWSDPTKWAGGTVADGAGSTAWFTNNITAAIKVTNDSSRTIGNVMIGDLVGTPSVFTFVAGGGVTLTFDKGANSANAQLTQTNPSAANIIGVPLALANSLDIANLDGSHFTITNGISGSGNLTLQANGSGEIRLSAVTLNNTGAITNAGSGTGLVKISGGVGANVTAITEDSASSALTISTLPLTVNSGGTTLANNNAGGAEIFTVSGGVNGTGDLVLKNNSAIADGIKLTGTTAITITNSGRVVNSGTGTGNTLISTYIRPPVSQVVQDSATSPLVLSAANTYTSGTTISNGTLRVINTTGSGTGTGGVGVNNGGILGGDGTISKTVTNFSGGTIAPGTNDTAIGTLTVGNLVWNGGGVYHCQIDDLANDSLSMGHYDHLSVTGALTAVPAGNLLIRMDSMGETLAFDTNRNYSLQVITCGTTPTLTSSDVTLDTSLFLLNDTGTWSVTNLNKSIWVVYRSSTQAGNNYWRGSGASTNWSTDANWSLNHVPQPGEGVEFDGFAGANCGAKGVNNNLKSITLSAGYTGTVTFVSNAVGGLSLTLTGDLTVREGALVFSGDTTAINGGEEGNPHGIGYAIQASNIIVGAGASINADYKGFASAGPGRAAAGAGSYGGQGGQSAVTNVTGHCYGSAIAPTALGSSGGSGAAGGGAIKLSAAGGTITVHGRLSANGQGSTSASGASGGSIWISAGTLEGTGLIAANGGDGGGAGSTGGGGRIDLSGVTNNFAGVIQAEDTTGSEYATRGLTGSILLPQSAGTGLTLNHFVPYTNIAFGNSLTFSNAVITNGVTVSLDANTNQNTFTFTSLTIATNSTVACLGNIMVINEAAGGTAAIPYGQGVTIIATNVTIQAGGSLNADGKGYRRGPGAGTFVQGDGVYGGLNRTQNGSTNSSGVLTNSTGSTYGSIANVTSLGCGSSYGSRGGGAIKLVVSDTLTVEGTISSSGEQGLSAGSGGSLWIDCASLQGAGTILADGGRGTGVGFSGSGGRIHILYTSKGGVNPIDNGRVSAYGGGTTLLRKSAAGTILLTDRGAGDLYGTLIVANNLAASNLVTTLLPTNTDCFAGTPPQVTVDRVYVRGTGVLEIPSNKTLNVVSVFSNGASFKAAGNSTVALVGTNAAFVYGTSNQFYNLSSTNVGKVIQFAANGTNSVLGVLTLKRCTLNSTVDGTWWYLGLDPAGSQNVNRVTVKDSNATNGQEIVTVRSTDSGHNIHWKFSNPGLGPRFNLR